MASRESEEEEGTGGSLADLDDIVAQYQTTRIRAFWASYKRCGRLLLAPPLLLLHSL